MILKQLLDEDFVNYKKPSMFIGFPFCTFKCEKECGEHCCQNSALAQASNIEIDSTNIVNRYLHNPITSALTIGGLEPFDTFNELLKLIELFRERTSDDIVIYTGYTEEELENGYCFYGNYNSNTRRDAYKILKQYPNIIIKFGRFIPNQEPHYDEVLGVKLASNNQYARRIS